MAVQNPSPNPPYSKPKGRQNRTCLILSILVFILILCVLCSLTIFVLSGIKDLNNSPLQVSDIYPINRTPPIYPTSGDQQAVVDQVGYPDSFTILFYDDEFGGTSTRLETWVYSQLGSKYTFINGVPEAFDHFDPLQGEIIVSPYHPEQFNAYMGLEDLIAATGIDEFLLLPLEDELVSGGETYFADRLAFGLKDGELMYLEVVGFEYSGEITAAEEGPEPESDTTGEPKPETSTDTQPETASKPESNAETQPDTGSTNQPSSMGHPMVYVSERNDPNWPDCENSDMGCRSEVFIFFPEGTGLVEFSLTSSAGFEWVSTPALSHDATQVVFAGSRDGNVDLYIVGIDGSGLQRITTDPREDWSPVWSPGDDQIAFVSRRKGPRRQNIFILDLASKEITQFSSGKYRDRFLDWSPDGSRLAFNSNRADPNPDTCYPDCQWQLYMLDLASSDIYPFPNGIGRDSAGITWSPDGSMMAFHSLVYDQYDLLLIDPDFNVLQLSHTAAANEVHPSWSPDGTHLVFGTDQNGNFDIAVTPITEFKPTFYTDHPAADFYPDW